MNLAASIAASHLLSRRRQTIVSLLGVVLGMGFFLAVSSLMRGSDDDFIKRLVDNAPHITVYDEFREPRLQPAASAFPEGAIEVRNVKPRTEVRGIRHYPDKLAFIQELPGMRVAPALVGQALVSYAGKDMGVALNGVVPDSLKHVSTIEEKFTAGSLDTLAGNPNGIVIGTELADKLKARMGANLTVSATGGAVRTMKVVGMFRTGNASYDEGQAFVILKRAQNLLNRPNVVNRLILKLEDPNLASDAARTIERATHYKAQSWQEASQDLLNLVKTRRIILYSVVGAILMVASFGIYNVISTVVLEKTRDIAILKAIGFHTYDIRRIFLIEGVIVGVLGSVFGAALGLGLMTALSRIEIKTPFDTSMTHMPLYWGWDQIALAAAFAIGSSVAAAYLPARKAGRLQPVETLRGIA
ncbi:MAG: ABC transporter permease [Burkholderiales bacterium]|nr:ABC transporter permease [Burkholderiales bacterium]